MIRQLNVLDLDGESVTFRLKENYLNEIKNRIANDGGLSKLGRSCDLDYARIWQAIKRNSTPLYILNAIKNYFDLQNIERHIEAYKSYSGRIWIRNPLLTIKESPELLELLGHCIGDGYLTLKKGEIGDYTNTSKVIVSKFKELCNKIFGKINLTTYSDKRFDAENVNLPRIISVIMTRFYPGVENKTIPSSISQLPKNYITSFIRAFADDESCVTTSAIYYTQKDKKVLEDIRNLHLLVGFKEENLTPVKRRGDIHTFSIIGKGLIYFYENIGYKHPDKMRDLGVEVKRKNGKIQIK